MTFLNRAHSCGSLGWMLRRIDWRWVLFTAVMVSLSTASGHFENPDAHLRLSQAFSLLAGRGFELGEGVGNVLHGNIAVAPDGRRFSVYGPGQILLFVPEALVGRWLSPIIGLQPHYAAELLASFLGPAVHAITGWLVFAGALALGRERATAVFSALAYGFATMCLPSARDGYEHPYEALAIMGALVLVWRGATSPRDKPRTAVLAGLILGVGVIFRVTTLLGLPAVIASLRSKRSRELVMIGLAPALAAVGYYNYVRFDNPLTTGYTAAWNLAHTDLPSASGFSLELLPRQAIALWVSPGKGLLVFSPILVMALVGAMELAHREGRAVRAVALTCGCYTVLYGTNFAWHGSAWCWGPRYLVPVVPLLSCMLPSPWSSKSIRYGMWLFGIPSLAIQVMALLVNYKRHLLELLLQRPQVFENGDIFYVPSLSPILALPRGLVHVVGGLMGSQPLYLFQAEGPWRNEGRPVGVSTMLRESIDLNALDLWWVRCLYFPLPESARYVLLGIGLTASTVLVFILYRVMKWERL